MTFSSKVRRYLHSSSTCCTFLCSTRTSSSKSAQGTSDKDSESSMFDGMLPAGVVVLADVGSGSGAAAAVACTFALGQGKGLVALRLARSSLCLLASPTSLDLRSRANNGGSPVNMGEGHHLVTQKQSEPSTLSYVAKVASSFLRLGHAPRIHA